MFSIWLSSWESPLDSLAGLNLGPDAKILVFLGRGFGNPVVLVLVESIRVLF